MTLPDPGGGAIRVLHVDDAPDFADLTATYLEREDGRIDVRTATGADEAEASLRERDFDCVVSDYDMPGRTGIDLLESVRGDYPDLPFILYTGKGSEEIASEAISAGVTDYLQKEGGTDQYAVLANRITNAVEHHRSQRMVERSQRRLREIIDALPYFLYVVDESGRYLLANEALADFHGVTVDDIQGVHVTDVLDEPAAEHFLGNLEDTLEAEMTRRVPEVEVVDSGGEARVLDPELHPYEFGDAGVRSALGVAVDVTERRERERELERVRERMEMALDQTESVIFDVDFGTGAVTRHGAYEQFFGHPPEEIPTWEDHCDRVVHPDDRDAFRQFHRELMDGSRKSGEIEYRTSAETGDVRWIRAHVHAAGPSNGRMLGVSRDVTERRERERELERARDLLEQAERVADVGGWEIDAEAMEVFWTEHLFDILGWEGDEEPPLGEALDVYHEDDRPVVEGGVERALEGGEPFDVEARFRRPDGEVRWLRVYGSPTVESGEGVSLRGAVQDVTERKSYEGELERQNARLSEFASVVSHDLRNPLNVAEGRLELAREGGDGEHLDAIERAHGRMEALIDDLLTLAREGQRPADVTAVDLPALAESCWRNVDTGGATLRVDADGAVRADEGRLRQLFENLFRNAVEHGGRGVTVTLGSLDGGFYVADDGVGIPDGEHERVFEAGYSTAEGGTGFGLRIVEQVADAHGWEVAATESDGGGARFDVTGVETPAG